MDLKEIKNLVRLFQETDINVLEVCEDGKKVRLEKNAHTAGPAVTLCPPGPGPGKAPAGGSAPQLSGGVDFNRIKEVKSPMIGVFYKAPAEDAEPFVKIGDKIKKGDVLCIIEAMKLMNEICAEEDGEIIDICAENGQIVEYGQTIFKIF